MFELHRIIIHEVRKNAHEQATSLDLSTNLADSDDESLALLVENVNTIYSKSPSIKNTQFKAEQDTIFSSLLKKYLNTDTDPNFYQFSKLAIIELKELIELVPLATGGFYCFADYTDHGRRCIAVILLRRKGGFNFVKESGTYKVSGTQTLNFDKIAMGFRLNVNIYKSEGDVRNSIALITAQQDELSDYFQTWVSVEDIITQANNTRSLVELVKKLPIPIGEDGEPMFPNEEAFRKACYKHVEESPQKKVNLMTMAMHFYGDRQERKILTVAAENDIIIDTEFKRDKKVWLRVISVNVRIPGVQLIIDFDKLNGNLVDIRDNHITIRSPELVQQIRSQQNG